jgi:hypothetical protein
MLYDEDFVADEDLAVEEENCKEGGTLELHRQYLQVGHENGPRCLLLFVLVSLAHMLLLEIFSYRFV